VGRRKDKEEKTHFESVGSRKGNKKISPMDKKKI